MSYIAGNVRGFKFSRFIAKKPHPPQALHVKYRCVGVSLVLIFVLTVLLEKRENLHHSCEILYGTKEELVW